MSTALSIGNHREDRPRRRRRIGRIIVLWLLLAAVVEPIVMYKALQHQRSHRASERTPDLLEIVPVDTGS